MYKSTISNIFNRHVPIKRKYICANEAPFVSKELYKTIMKISRLRNIFLEYPTDTNKKSYSTQRNLCKKLLRNTMKSYFENLETIKKNTGNRSFLRIVLLFHYLPKIYQKIKKSTSLMMVKPCPLTRSSVRH